MTPEQIELAKSHPAAFNAGAEVEQERSAVLCDLAAAAGASPARAINQGWSVAQALQHFRASAVAAGRSRDFEAKLAELGLGGAKTQPGSSAAPDRRPTGSASDDLGDRVVAVLEARRGGPAPSTEPASAHLPAAVSTGARDFADDVADHLEARLGKPSKAGAESAGKALA